MSNLEGATASPAPSTEFRDAGEFAALWNAADVDTRERVAQQIKDNAAAANVCLIADHLGAVEEVSRLRGRLFAASESGAR